MKPILSFSLSVFLLFLTACVRDTDLTVKDAPMIVVECILSDDPVQTLTLSQTKIKSASTYEPVPEAEARLIDLTENKTVGQFSQKAEGEWTMDYAGVPGHLYRLEVQVPGRELIYAEDTMPSEPSEITTFVIEA